MANVKVFADRQTDRQTDRRTDGQAKNYMPPIFRYGGIKKVGQIQHPEYALKSASLVEPMNYGVSLVHVPLLQCLLLTKSVKRKKLVKYSIKSLHSNQHP